MERQGAAGFAPDLDLAARNYTIAQNADPLVVERMPFPAQIVGLEEREFVFRKKGRVHLESGQIKASRRSF